MKSIITTLFSLCFLTSIAQTSNFIEIAVSETVQLHPKSITVNLSIESLRQQRRAFYREEFGRDEYDYEFGYYEEYNEEDYLYEEMMYENPKKVTKEMTKAYEERAREREERAKEKMEREEAFQKKWEARRKLTYSELSAKITALGFSAKVIKRGALDELYVDWDEEYYEEDYYGEEGYGYSDEYGYSDSLVQVIVTNSADWDRLKAAITDLPIEKNIHGAEYNTLNDEFAEVIPNLTKKAQAQAQIMATSMNRKLGKILSCTNVYPYTPSKHMMASYTRSIERLYENRGFGNNPFESTKDEVIEYIYKFELL